MAGGKDFDNLSPHDQTDVIKLMDLSPKEIETLVSSVDNSRLQARNTVASLITGKTDMLTVLHRIGSGEAFQNRANAFVSCLLSSGCVLTPNEGTVSDASMKSERAQPSFCL